jgi:MOSC domain-containing protein YiiM
MKNQEVGKILELFISTKDKTDRTSQTILDLDENGIKNDKFYGKNIERSILITSIESYQLSSKNHIDMNYGQLGENIVIDYNPYHLKNGSQLQIGDTILEITQHCTLCKSLGKIDSKLPKLLQENRGIFAKVIKDGNIKKDDKVYLLNKNRGNIYEDNKICA